MALTQCTYRYRGSWRRAGQKREAKTRTERVEPILTEIPQGGQQLVGCSREQSEKAVYESP